MSSFGGFETPCCMLAGGALQGVPLAAPALALLAQVAQGLRYMHAGQIPHGNVTASNVLLSSDGKASLGCLTGVCGFVCWVTHSTAALPCQVSGRP